MEKFIRVYSFVRFLLQSSMDMMNRLAYQLVYSSNNYDSFSIVYNHTKLLEEIGGQLP